MEIEDYLRRFAPAAPPSGLKARVLAEARPRGSWPIVLAAAASLVALWLANEHAERGLRAALDRGATEARVARSAEGQLPLLAQLRKEIQ